MKSENQDERGRFTEGNLAAWKHGAYTFLRTGHVPHSVRGRRLLNKRLAELRAALEQAVEDSPQRRVLISQVVRTEGLLAIVESYFRRFGLMDEGKLKRNKLEPQPVLAKVYLGLLNSQRLALQGLGLDARKAKTLDVMAYVKAFDKAKEAKAVPTVSPDATNDEPEKVAR
jgi:hypothetical protein